MDLKWKPLGPKPVYMATWAMWKNPHGKGPFLENNVPFPLANLADPKLVKMDQQWTENCRNAER